MTMYPKNATIRLVGKELSALRIARFLKDDGRCRDCNEIVWLDAPQGHPRKMDLAHVISRGAGGPDTLENTLTKCAKCHGKEHTEGRLGKPCPKKERTA